MARRGDGNLRLELLELFVNVAATGSFSRTALLLDATQSSVSKQVLALELELAARLFERTGRGARLTEAGRALLPHAEALIRQTGGLRDLLADELTLPRGTVHLAMQPSVAWPLMRDLHLRLRREHPAVRLKLSEAPTRQIVDWLREGVCDVGVLSRPRGDPSLPNATPLFDAPISLIAKPGDPLTRRATVPFSRLQDLPLVIAAMPNGGRVLLEELARRRGLRLNVALDVYSIHQIKKLVREGIGYTIALRAAVSDELALGQLSAARIVAPILRQEFCVSVAALRPPSAAVRAVAQLVREIAPGLARAPDG